MLITENGEGDGWRQSKYLQPLLRDHELVQAPAQPGLRSTVVISRAHCYYQSVDNLQ